MSINIFFVTALLAVVTLPAPVLAGQVRGQETNYSSPGGVTEQCIALVSIPGGKYRPGDRKQEQKYCGIDFYNANTALCPKIWSTSPGTIIYDLSAGNHDASASPGFQLERDVYREQWENNKTSLLLLDGGNYPFNYGFTVNGVLFAALDATIAGPLPPVQMKWLGEVLAKEGQRSIARIVFGHLPVWSLTVGRERGILRDTNLEQLFVEKVSVYLSGHQHGFYPFYHNDQYYVGQAALGSGPRRLIGDKNRSPRAFTFIEIATDGTLNVTAHTGPDFNQVVQRSTLPPQITYNGITIVRDDLGK